jgi:hypothetical protein
LEYKSFGKSDSSKMNQLVLLFALAMLVVMTSAFSLAPGSSLMVRLIDG